MVSAAMAEVEAGSKDKHVALVSKAYLVLLLHILTLVRDNNDYRLQNYRIILCNRRVLQTFWCKKSTWRQFHGFFQGCHDYLFQYFSAIGFSLSVITCITTLKQSSSFHWIFRRNSFHCICRLASLTNSAVKSFSFGLYSSSRLSYIYSLSRSSDWADESWQTCHSFSLPFYSIAISR